MAREISARGAQGVPAYTVLSDEEIKDQEAAKAKLDRLGFSGAVVMRVVGSQTQYTVVEPALWARPHYHRYGEATGAGAGAPSGSRATSPPAPRDDRAWSCTQSY
jgi:hypothetical protein